MTPGADPEGTEPSRSAPAVLHLMFALLLAGVAFLRQITALYSYDDTAVLDVVAFWRSGSYGWIDLLFLPHNEHFIPGLRGLMALVTRFAGADATAAHVVLVAVHGCGGFLLGRLAAAAGASRPIAWATTAFYVTAATSFAPSAVWYATGAVVMVAWVAALAGVEAITRDRPWSGSFTALAGLLLGTSGGIPGLAAPWLALLADQPTKPATAPIEAIEGTLPAATDDRRSDRRGMWTDRRWLAAAGLAALALLALGTVRAVYLHYSHRPFPAIHPSGVATAAVLVGSAPGRIARAFFDDLPVAWSIGCGWLVVAIGFWRLPTRGRRLALCLSGGAAALALAVGLVRPEYRWADFEGADRYYYPLLAPLTLIAAGCFFGRRGSPGVAGEARTVLAWVAALVPLWAGQAPLAERFPASGLDAYRLFWPRMEALADAVDREALAGGLPWRLVDGQVPGERIHGGGIRLRTLMLAAHRGAVPRDAFAAPGAVSPQDLRRQNTAFDRWAEALGERVTPICAGGGGLVPPRPAVGSWLDFAQEAHDESIVAGVEPWAAPIRFLGASPGRFRLRRGFGDFWVRGWVPPLNPTVREIEVVAALDGHPLGAPQVARRDAETVLRFAVLEASAPSPDALVEITLTASPTWRPTEHLPNNGDGRSLSLGLLDLGFRSGAAPPTPAPPRAVRCLGAVP
jgi:hypothetical protein